MQIPFVKYNHKKHLDELAKIQQCPKDYEILYSPADYRHALLTHINNAQTRIYLIALYLERDEAGQEILEALYQAKQQRPHLDIKVIVDWHRAQRGRIGENGAMNNAMFYHQTKLKYPNIDIPVYGVPVNRREVLGVLHLKGSIIDDVVLYTGASINNVYLNKLEKYRYDRYHVIKNKALADSMIDYVDQNILTFSGVQPLDLGEHKTRKELKHNIRMLRQHLITSNYQYPATVADDNQLTVAPIAGLGRQNALNKVIHHLISSAAEQVIFCTPYFNLPTLLIKDVIRLLRRGKHVEIIVGDKTANDFYIPEDEPFNIVGGLPYLYEVNLRRFIERLQHFVDNEQLSVRLWKNEDHSYHLKGIWVDDEWILMTGNNLNPRAWRLDLENGILVHDPKQQLHEKLQKELDLIRKNTTLVTHFQQIQAHQFYPKHVSKLIKRVKRTQIERIIKRLL